MSWTFAFKRNRDYEIQRCFYKSCGRNSIYFRKKKFQLKNAIIFGIICAIGGVIGAYITVTIDETLLKQIIIGAILALLIFTIFKKEAGLKDSEYKIKNKHLFLLIPIMFVLGIYGGAIGMATPTFLAFFFVLQGQSFTQSMGMAVFLGFLISLGSAIIFLIHGAIIFTYAIPQAIASALGAYLGSHYAIKRGNAWVKVLFIVVASVFLIKLILEAF
ncbi:TPA: hypothetical protein DCZ16_02385 [Candidatus Peregrinibacteria bacterium]|nr:hypothetical protein [Candidatus Peregrinibacteria bacterium]